MAERQICRRRLTALRSSIDADRQAIGIIMSNFGYRALKLAPAAVLTAALLTALAGCDSNPPRPAVAAARQTRHARRWPRRSAPMAPRMMPAHCRSTLPLARAGNADAQFRVARIYTRNKGVAPNAGEACNWWENCRQRWRADRRHQLRALFESGKGRGQSIPLPRSGTVAPPMAATPMACTTRSRLRVRARRDASFDNAMLWLQRALDARIDSNDAADVMRHLKRARNNVEAARGDPQAQYDLAIDLFNGHPPR